MQEKLKKALERYFSDRLGTLETAEIDRVLETLHKGISLEHNSLVDMRKEAQNSGLPSDQIDNIIEGLSDDIVDLEEMTTLGNELATLALYKKIERRIKAIGNHYIKGFKSQKGSNVDYLIKILPTLSSVSYYAAYSELRCINNCIKHSGVVSAALAKFPGWTEGQALSGLGGAYDRLKPQVVKFIRALATEAARVRTT